jgi:hypothetical protein
MKTKTNIQMMKDPPPAWMRKHKQAKYRPGKLIGMIGVLNAIADHRYMWYGDEWHGRPMHWAWVQNMTICSVEGMIRRGTIREAIEMNKGPTEERKVADEGK